MAVVDKGVIQSALFPYSPKLKLVFAAVPTVLLVTNLQHLSQFEQSITNTEPDGTRLTFAMDPLSV